MRTAVSQGCRPAAGWGVLAVRAVFLAWGASSACAQFGRPATLVARSRSGQFVIQAVAGAAADRRLAGNRNLIHLDPTLLTVSGERLKSALWGELGVEGPWRGKVFINLYPAQTAEDALAIEQARLDGTWRYHVLMPDRLDRLSYVRGMTQVLLLELANREAGDHTAEVPTWLVEGLARQLLAANGAQIIVPAPETEINGLTLTPTFFESARTNPLEQAHADLTASPPLSFQELSWPSGDDLVGAAGERFRGSAQLFVDRLLHFPDGGACLRAMLTELPRHYNWQFAFLQAFKTHFQRPLDVEKWWALELAHFTGRDLADAWPREESWQRLEQAMHSPVQVRVEADALPVRAEVPLQTVIRDWNRPAQTYTLQNKLAELYLLRQRVPPELVPLVDNYGRTVTTFLRRRDEAGLLTLFRKSIAERRAAREAVKELNALDARREALRKVRPHQTPAPAPTPTPPAQASAPPPQASRLP